MFKVSGEVEITALSGDVIVNVQISVVILYGTKFAFGSPKFYSNTSVQSNMIGTMEQDSDYYRPRPNR